MKALILSGIAALGLVATPALANSPVQATRAQARNRVAEVCNAQRGLAKAKKESWKVAGEKCEAAKRQARMQVGQAKIAQKQQARAARVAKKG